MLWAQGIHQRSAVAGVRLGLEVQPVLGCWGAGVLGCWGAGASMLEKLRTKETGCSLLSSASGSRNQLLVTDGNGSQRKVLHSPSYHVLFRVLKALTWHGRSSVLHFFIFWKVTELLLLSFPWAGCPPAAGQTPHHVYKAFPAWVTRAPAASLLPFSSQPLCPLCPLQTCSSLKG